MIETASLSYSECNPEWRDKIPHWPNRIGLQVGFASYLGTRLDDTIYAVMTDEVMVDLHTELLMWMDSINAPPT